METRSDGSRTPEQDRVPGRILAALLRVPLFHKIVLANLALLGLGVLGGGILIPRLSSTGEGLATAVLAVAVLVAATLVNVSLVRAALRPIHSLQETALRVEAGDESARARSTSVADRQITGVVRVFNRMLDHQTALRLSERDRAGRILKQMDDEKTRSSYELYDNLAQLLAGVLLRLRLLEQTPALKAPEWNGRDNQAPTLLEEIRSQVLEALEGTRGVARRLHPPELKELGLGYALDALARSITDETGLRIDVHADHGAARISDDTRLAVFRVAEGALRNAAEHAHASRATVTLTYETDRICLEVRDDGSGFDTVSAMRGRTGLGLASMLERAGQVGGSVDIKSRLGRGSCIRMTAPLFWREMGDPSTPTPDSLSSPLEAHP
jgi:two-component system sensor histidine kinase UhpB